MYLITAISSTSLLLQLLFAAVPSLALIDIAVPRLAEGETNRIAILESFPIRSRDSSKKRLSAEDTKHTYTSRAHKRVPPSRAIVQRTTHYSFDVLRSGNVGAASAVAFLLHAVLDDACMHIAEDPLPPHYELHVGGLLMSVSGWSGSQITYLDLEDAVHNLLPLIPMGGSVNGFYGNIWSLRDGRFIGNFALGLA